MLGSGPLPGAFSKMQWKQTQLNALRIGRNLPSRLSTRAFLLSAFFSVGLSASFCSASDVTNDVVSVEHPGLVSNLTLDDLDSETRATVLNLARDLAGGEKAAAATVEDNVASILALLNSVIQYTSRVWKLHTLPTFEAGGNTGSLGGLLGYLFYEGATLEWPPLSSKSYLYEIQRALYGQSGVPSSSQAVVPILSRIESALTNSASSVDMSYTNSISAILRELDGTQGQVSLSSWLSNNDQIASYISSLAAYIVNCVGYDTSPYPGAVFQVREGSLADVWELDASGAGMYDSALRVVDANVLAALQDLEYTAEGILNNGSGPQVVVISNLQELIRHIDQVTNYQATVSEEYQAAQSAYGIAQDEYEGQNAYEEQLDYDSSGATDMLATNEPVYAVSYTDNPMTPLAQAVDFSQTMRSQMPDVSKIETSSRVYLFKTDWDSEGVLTSRGLSTISFDLSGSDPHVPNDFYNYCQRIMAWAWNLAALVTAFALFRDFWNWVASWRA